MRGKTRENDCAQGEECEDTDQAGRGKCNGVVELPKEDKKPREEQRRGNLKENRQNSDDLLYAPLLQTVESQLTKSRDLTRLPREPRTVLVQPLLDHDANGCG